MFVRDLMFANPLMQYRFAEKTRSLNEVGGWLIVDAEPYSWPGAFSEKKVKQAFGIENSFPGINYINGFVVFPNEAKSPRVSWSTWDYRKAFEIAHATAKSYGYWSQALHFHTHPGYLSSPFPSNADLGFAAQTCSDGEGFAWFVIGTSYPFCLHPYSYEWGQNPSKPDKTGGGLKRGQMLSWHTKAGRSLRRES